MTSDSISCSRSSSARPSPDLGGGLFTANNGYVGPTVFDINQASEFLLWVIAGGLGTLAGPMIASFAFQYLQTFLGTNQVLNTPLVFGAIIIFFVLLVPRGILPSLRDAANVLVSMVRVVRARFRAAQLIERRT